MSRRPSVGGGGSGGGSAAAGWFESERDRAFSLAGLGATASWIEEDFTDGDWPERWTIGGALTQDPALRGGVVTKTGAGASREEWKVPLVRAGDRFYLSAFFKSPAVPAGGGDYLAIAVRQSGTVNGINFGLNGGVSLAKFSSWTFDGATLASTASAQNADATLWHTGSVFFDGTLYRLSFDGEAPVTIAAPTPPAAGTWMYACLVYGGNQVGFKLDKLFCAFQAET